MVTEPRINFHEGVGLCISEWANLEEQLFEICHMALGTSKAKAAIVYFKTPTLDARLTLTDEIVLATLSKPERKDGGHPHADVIAWTNLRIKIQNQLSTRRRIAHHPIRTKKTDSFFSVPSVFSLANIHDLTWLEIYTSENEQLRGKSPTEPLLLKDLYDHYKEITTLTVQLHAFLSETLPRHIG